MKLIAHLHARFPETVRLNLESDPILKDLEIPTKDTSEMDVAFRTLTAFSKGEGVPEPQLTRSFDIVLRGVGRALRLQPIPDADVPRRPQEEGLTEAMMEMSTAVQELGSTKLASLTYDPAANRELALTITTYRNTARLFVRFLTLLMRNIAVKEAGGESTLRSNYSLIRALAKVDPDMANLETVDDYLFASAEKGVDTRRDNKRTLASLTTRAAQEGQAAANRKARATLADELTAMLEDIRRTTPLTDNRNEPR
jgi:hypothetical protein